jgi:predicted metal-dependent hydrolase
MCGSAAHPSEMTGRHDGEREDALNRGVELIRAGDYFGAHEELETAWRAAPPEERDFYQGLVHVAVAWYQAGRGRRVGCERQLEKARRRLAPFAPGHRGVDVARVLEQVDGAAAQAARGRLDLGALEV